VQVGIEEVLINLNAHAASVCEFLRLDTNGPRVRVVVEQQLLGSVERYAPIATGSYRTSSSGFYADVLNRADLEGMADTPEAKAAATLGVYEVPDPRRCGIVIADSDGLIQEFVEKPEHPAGNLAFSGIMIGTPEVLDVIPDTVPADIGFHVLPRLAGRMIAYSINDYLLDIGTMENYEKAQATWPGLREA
jgi:mannose-1-phosphate guanylyltransferase